MHENFANPIKPCRQRLNSSESIRESQIIKCSLSLHSAYLVLLVVAGEVGEDARGAGHDVHVCRPQQLDQTLTKYLSVISQLSNPLVFRIQRTGRIR